MFINRIACIILIKKTVKEFAELLIIIYRLVFVRKYYHPLNIRKYIEFTG